MAWSAPHLCLSAPSHSNNLYISATLEIKHTTHSQYKEKSTELDENLPAEKDRELEHEEQTRWEQEASGTSIALLHREESAMKGLSLGPCCFTARESSSKSRWDLALVQLGLSWLDAQAF